MIDSFYRRLGWPATERLVVRAEQGARADVYPRGYVVLGLVKPVLPVLPGVKSARTSLRKRSPPRTWQTLGPERNRVSGKVWPGSAVWRLGRRLRREGARRHGFVKRRAGCRRCRCTEGRGRGVTVRVAVRRRPVWRLLRALPAVKTLCDPVLSHEFLARRYTFNPSSASLPVMQPLPRKEPMSYPSVHPEAGTSSRDFP